jgi:hypothetical protein
VRVHGERAVISEQLSVNSYQLAVIRRIEFVFLWGDDS